MEMGVVGFTVTVFVLGFFMALGKAAVYKHIPAYYPDHVGSVGGLVGMIGGLGGFVLPILFGVLLDLTGLWTSCFMALFVLVSGALVWMHMAIRQMEREQAAMRSAKLPPFPEMQGMPRPAVVPRSERAVSTDWRPEDPAFLGRAQGRQIARRNLWLSDPGLLLSFAVWQVWSVVVAKLPLVGFTFTTDELFWLAALPGLSGATLRIFYSFMVPIFGGRLWTTLTTWSLIIPALGIGYAVQNPDTPYVVLLILALLCGFGGGNFASSMANISFFFPKAEKGNALALNAGLGNLGVSVVQFVVPLAITAGIFGWLGGDPAMVKGPAGEAPLWLQNAGFIFVPFIATIGFCLVVRHERHRCGQGVIRGAGGDFPAQAQLDHVLALHRHLRFLHRLFGRLPAPHQDSVSGSQRAPVRLSWTARRCPFPLRDGLARRQVWRCPRYTSGPSSLMMAGVFGVLWFIGIKDQAGRLLGLLRCVPGVVLCHRRRQCLDLPDDPGDHGQGDGASDAQADAETRRRQAEKKSAAITGFTSAIAAFGAFFIPKSYGTSIALTGGPQAALWGFLLFYVSCLAVTWAVYTRKGGLLHEIERARRTKPSISTSVAD